MAATEVAEPEWGRGVGEGRESLLILQFWGAIASLPEGRHGRC